MNTEQKRQISKKKGYLVCTTYLVKDLHISTLKPAGSNDHIEPEIDP
jgi:hypothetical protein